MSTATSMLGFARLCTTVLPPSVLVRTAVLSTRAGLLLAHSCTACTRVYATVAAIGVVACELLKLMPHKWPKQQRQWSCFEVWKITRMPRYL